MEDSVKIFTFCHKTVDYGFEVSDLREPLQVGKENHKDLFVCNLCDNTGDNISYKNNYFLETTGLYWVWKNTDYTIKGCEHYRRRFNLTKNTITQILGDDGIITFTPIIFNQNTTVKTHYDSCHNIKDLELCEEIVKEIYPDMWPDFDNYINKGHTLYTNNSFITSKENFDKICNILFSILFKYEKTMGFKNDNEWLEYAKTFTINPNTVRWIQLTHPELSFEQYQMRICGYLSERILTFIIQTLFTKDQIHTNNPIKLEKYI